MPNKFHTRPWSLHVSNIAGIKHPETPIKLHCLCRVVNSLLHLGQTSRIGCLETCPNNVRMSYFFVYKWVKNPAHSGPGTVPSKQKDM